MRSLLRVAPPALFLFLGALGTVWAQEPDQITTPAPAGSTPRFHGHQAWGSHKAHQPPNIFGPGVTGIDSLVNFTGSFTAPGVDPNGNPQSVWPFSMVGNDPARSHTTVINSSVIPVSVLLLDANGLPRYVGGQLLYQDASQYVQPVLNSPVFGSHWYSSSEIPTQFADAVGKAEYGHEATSDWHTILAPAVKQGRLMTLPKGSYRFALNADGSCCSYILVDENVFGNALFPPTYPVDGTTIIGAAELAGDMTTKEIGTLLFNNVYLYSTNPDGSTSCCVLGYHSYDSEPGLTATANPRAYVMIYASWITPGLFTGLADITGLSHEMVETYNDPFLNNITPWWLAPNGNCQDNLEGGDVIEGLTNDVYPITMNGYTYHPQNVALLPWFEFSTPTKGLPRAYSFPDMTVLTSPAAPQALNCGQ